MAETTVTIKSPIEVVWEALTNLQAWAWWWPRVKDVEAVQQAQPPHLGVGDVAKLTISGLLPVSQRVTVTTVEAPTSFAFTTESADGGFRFDYQLLQSDEGIQVRQQLEPTSTMGRISSAIMGQYQSELEEEAEALKAHCESRIAGV